MSLLDGIRINYRAGGLRAVVSRAMAGVYLRGVRPLLPTRRHVRYNGIPIHLTLKWFDGLLPPSWLGVEHQDFPAYESALMKGLSEHVRDGDRVVVIGGGWGVTTVAAAQRAGASGRVTTYEAGREAAEHIREALALSTPPAPVEVVHGVVAHANPVFLRGATAGSRTVAPGELPDCDVLEMDCEGAEMEILPGLTVRPRVLLVETHGLFKAPTAEVRALVERLGYDVVHEEVAEQGLAAFCEANDIRVLTAVRRAEEGPT
jgi:hypothetical protein